VTEDEIATLAEGYPLTDSVMYMCRMVLAFQEPIDDNDATADDKDGLAEDESDDTGPGDGDTDAGDGDGIAASWIFPPIWQPANLKHMAKRPTGSSLLLFHFVLFFTLRTLFCLSVGWKLNFMVHSLLLYRVILIFKRVPRT